MTSLSNQTSIIPSQGAPTSNQPYKEVLAVIDDLKITGASKITKQYTYDSLDRVITETDAQNNTISYTYDDVGNKISSIVASGCH